MSIIQVDIRTIIVPYVTDDGSKFKIVTAGGSTLPVTSATDNGDGTTTLTSSSDLAGTYYVGLEYELRYKLGNLIMKSQNSDGRSRSTNRSVKDNLQTMTFSYSDTATFKVEVERPKRDLRIVDFISAQLGYVNVGEADLGTGDFRFHVKGKTRDTKITVTDTSVFPIQLQHVEIERSITSRSKR
jgi:hypothetical protein